MRQRSLDPGDATVCMHLHLQLQLLQRQQVGSAALSSIADDEPRELRFMRWTPHLQQKHNGLSCKSSNSTHHHDQA